MSLMKIGRPTHLAGYNPNNISLPAGSQFNEPWPACGAGPCVPTTTDLEKVDCLSCRRTVLYKNKKKNTL
jgi:hypothetical protein